MTNKTRFFKYSSQRIIFFLSIISILCQNQIIFAFSPPTPPNLDKGFNILETASKVIPQGRLVQTAKETWKFAWQRMMAELAPQDKKTGAYTRPTYSFQGTIGSSSFPDEAGRYHVYVGNPCPWCHRVRLALAVLKIAPKEVGVTQLVDDPVKASRGGWVFDKSLKDKTDPLGSTDLVRVIYDAVNMSMLLSSNL